MSTWIDEYRQMVGDCEKRQSRLTDWETEFVDSISTQLERGKILSAKQIETLENIWERATAHG